ncbi:MAG: choice-of-anchor J domain-containing protein [Bacteroidales bacterium]|nr:choice-of-anchor J domain-containing protein [Bacteroidales bacterium]
MKQFKNFILLIVCALVSQLSLAQAADYLFYADFNDGCDVAEWTVYDANSDGATWSIDEQLNGYIYNGMNTQTEANDWLFTPSFAVEAGKSYIVTFTIAQRGAFEADNIVVSYGKEASHEKMEGVVLEESFDMHGAMTTRRCRIYMPETANYVLGIKLTSPAGNGIVSLKGISVEASNASTPMSVPAMVANMDGATQSVKIEWYNPLKDVENAFISDKMDARIYVDDVLVETVENVLPGKQSEYIYKPTTVAGKHTISVAVAVNGVESEKVSKELDFDDIVGSLSPV